MSRDNLRFALVCGGTGGHIYPGLALADELKSRLPRAELLFLGGREGLERELVPRAGYPLELISARRRPSVVLLFAFFQAWRRLRRFAPQALISTGGCASLPAVAAAKLLAVPIYLHEQNLLPGFTNRLCVRWARRTFLSFPGSERYLPGVLTGNPVRREILSADRDASRRRLGFAPGDRVVLIMGGSQGARSINQAVVAALPKLSSEIKIIHVVGNRDAELVDAALKGAQYPFYRKVNYLYNVGEMLAAADLAVSRAGATAIAEFTARGLPMVLVPFPFSAAGHQELNARAIAAAGAGLCVENDEFTPEKFAALAGSDNLDLPAMAAAARRLGRPEAASEIIGLILSDLKEANGP
ncbi:MAG: undecaprenyldiphospho-muramoylpentapeptide beta-N-acetylglucosaminyltransferase [Candidatus Saganbacteria bacterium]|nr:undecaprenyldiphospho-muramoylpentapeptide beta-N-acetylglucosaminyltransferase [Candidatus Saganbacteria bacterium]